MATSICNRQGEWSCHSHSPASHLGDDADTIQASSSSTPFRTMPSASSSQMLPPYLTMRRSNPNPKRLSLSLPIPASSSTSPATSEMSTATPYTPGPPKTPALAMSMGRSSDYSGKSAGRRASLLSLVTQPPSDGNSQGHDDMPPTPGPNRISPMKSLRPIRVRAQSDITVDTPHPPMQYGPQTALPITTSFPAIDEDQDMSHFSIMQSTTPTSISTSPASLGNSDKSTYSTPSSSPPYASTSHLPLVTSLKSSQPYVNGPIEIFPSIYLGSEESSLDLSWIKGKQVRIINVAQEIDDPYLSTLKVVDRKQKGKVELATYEGENMNIEYCHLSWSHGDAGLAELPDRAELEHLSNPELMEVKDNWTFWDAIMWLEIGRRRDVPTLIHCQCGVSRSATLAIAYLMSLAACGLEPDKLGHLRTMQETYDMVKSQSPWIGPNVSLVYQLIEYYRNLTSLISKHNAVPDSRELKTSFPTLEDAAVSEAEWARKRREFEDAESEVEQEDENVAVPGVLGSPMTMTSRAEAGDEAKRWDEAMIQRRQEKL